VARWRRRGRGRIEAPEWYQQFDPQTWDEPDAQEQAMINGCPSMRPWPEDVHRWHAERRWGEAKHRYRLAYPALAEQDWVEFVASLSEPRLWPGGAASRRSR
jgi:hypothetical protein